MDTTIHIRPFTDQDQVAARALILAGLGEHFGFIDETLNPDLDDITAHYLIPDQLFLVAEHQQTLVGTGALLFQSAATGQIVRVSTHSAYRRRGIARAICQQLIEHARQRDLCRLLVETNRNWDDALKLYHDLGFCEDTHDAVSSYLVMALGERNNSQTVTLT